MYGWVVSDHCLTSCSLPESKPPNFKVSGLNPPLPRNKGQATFWNFRWHMDIIKRIQDLQLLCRLFFSSSKFGRVFFVGGFFLITQELPVFFLGTLKLLVGLANLHSDSTQGCHTFSWRACDNGGFGFGADLGRFLDLDWQIGTEVSQNLELKKLLFVLWTYFLVATFRETFE